MSARGTRRLVPVLAILLVGATTALAQRGFRGGGGFFTPSYSGNVKYDGKFVFVRMSYPWQGFRQPAWMHDYQDGEVHFMKILTGVSNVPAHVQETNILSFGDPEMFKYPVIYLCEPGYWDMNDKEVVALRDYFRKGGFMIVDDFPSWAWPNFDLQMSRVFPTGQWHDLTAEHPIFHSFFEINSLDLPPPYPQLGSVALYRGLYEDNDPSKRLYVIANYQNDISEYWEWSETGMKPVDENNEAYKFGVNEFIYGITH
jgi:hypothetical protein